MTKDQKKKFVERQLKTGKFFGIEYQKKDGTITEMNVHGRVKENLVGGTNFSNPKQHVVVWDINRKRKTGNGYRTLLLDGILSVTVKGIKKALNTPKLPFKV